MQQDKKKKKKKYKQKRKNSQLMIYKRKISWKKEKIQLTSKNRKKN